MNMQRLRGDRKNRGICCFLKNDLWEYGTSFAFIYYIMWKVEKDYDFFRNSSTANLNIE